jgi:hypothetical protein
MTSAGGFRVSVAVTLVASPGLAEAHAPIEGLGTFYGHLIDPFVAPSHGLLLIAAALICGQQGRGRARIGVIALFIAFAIGSIVAQARIVDGVREQILLCVALVIGCAVIFDRRIPSFVIAVATAGAGLSIGLDVETGGASQREAVLAFAGISTGVVYLTIVIVGLTVGLTKHWHRVGIRIAGSWIVAASVLVLALSFAAPVKRAGASIAPIVEETSQC